MCVCNTIVVAVLIELKFPTDLHRDFGAPAKAWVEITNGLTGHAAKCVSGSHPDLCVRVTVSIFDKTATRLPEAL